MKTMPTGRDLSGVLAECSAAGLICGDQFGEFTCTRSPDHELPHIADGSLGSGGRAIWPTFVSDPES